MQNEQLIGLTSDIVSAFVQNNAIAANDVPAMIGSIHAALKDLGTEVIKIAPGPEPAVSARKSVTPDHVICMVCGEKQKMLKRHLMTAHDLTPEAYRAKFGLPADHPLVAPNYAEKRAAIAKATGLGRKRG
jgi:predicted transcriptional regulator